MDEQSRRTRKTYSDGFKRDAGRLVVKDTIVMGAALATMADSAKACLARRAATESAR